MLSSMDHGAGYSHPEYARSLAAHGEIRALPHSGGWVIARRIPRSGRIDAMGLYPFFQCRDWEALPSDLEDLRRDGLVSLVLVTDPMLDAKYLDVFRAFDLARSYKTHYLADLERPIEKVVSKHHRYYARKAAEKLEVDVPPSPAEYLDEWCAIYARLVERHECADLRVFSREGFSRVLSMPGVVLLRALRRGELVGAQIVLVGGDTAYAHLAAFTDEGYELGASYLLDWWTMEILRGSARWVNWGGGTGSDDSTEGGLARYKKGWTSETRATYLLGAVLDRTAYEELCTGLESAGVAYFPRYRAGEFG